MKITFVLPPLGNSGGIRVVAIYAKLLQEMGHQVYCVAPPHKPADFREQIRSVLKGKGWIPSRKINESHFSNNHVSCHFLDRHRPVEARDVPDSDVVVGTWWETMEWVNSFPPSKGEKIYFIQHYEVFNYTPKDRVEATYRLPCKKVVVAQWLSDILANQYGQPGVPVVPNAINLKDFHAEPRGRQKVPTLGVMYSHVDWKGCDVSLEAFKLASRVIPDLRLVAFSDSPATESLPLPPRAEFHVLPSAKVIRECYSKCDGWLFGSRTEGFGLPILESMACRTPVIGTPVGAAPELLCDGAGILLKSHKPEEMSEAIIKLFKLSGEEWVEMSNKAFTRATKYTWKDAVVLFEQFLIKSL